MMVEGLVALPESVGKDEAIWILIGTITACTT